MNHAVAYELGAHTTFYATTAGATDALPKCSTRHFMITCGGTFVFRSGVGDQSVEATDLVLPAGTHFLRLPESHDSFGYGTIAGTALGTVAAIEHVHTL